MWIYDRVHDEWLYIEDYEPVRDWDRYGEYGIYRNFE